MPELPEVEVCRRGILPELAGQTITAAVVRFPRLRREIPSDLDRLLVGRRIADIVRRGKYLLFDCATAESPGWLILHLGMSGNLRFVSAGETPGRHDHFDLIAGERILRYSDPRRFGLIDWQAGPAERHPLIAGLGIEPLSPAFDGEWLYRASRGRKAPIKAMLMDARQIVGIGNIYAAESLFRAGISPLRPAGQVSRAGCVRLVAEIRQTLQEAIAAGGSSIRDYIHSDGGAGCFQLEYAVYDRTGQDCRRCGGTVKQVRQSGRSSFFCPGCQK